MPAFLLSFALVLRPSSLWPISSRSTVWLAFESQEAMLIISSYHPV
jgi:hypothetical protein